MGFGGACAPAVQRGLVAAITLGFLTGTQELYGPIVYESLNKMDFPDEDLFMAKYNFGGLKQAAGSGNPSAEVEGEIF